VTAVWTVPSGLPRRTEMEPAVVRPELRTTRSPLPSLLRSAVLMRPAEAKLYVSTVYLEKSVPEMR
jgi:hypothetical protein